MSEGMRGNLSSFRSYLSQARSDPRGTVSAVRDQVRRTPSNTPRDLTTAAAGAHPEATDSRAQTWGQWAGQKLRQITGGNEDGGRGNVEKIFVFPGWASRHYHDSAEGERPAGDNAPFDVHLSVSGWASSHNPAGVVSRSQRAFIRLAKGYASLPKLSDSLLPPGSQTPDTGDLPLSKSTEDLLKEMHLPPPPSKMTEEAELAELEARLRSLDSDSRPTSPTPSTRSTSSTNSNALQQLHANLEARLLPFWSSVLSARTVRLSLYAARADLPGERDLLSARETYGPLGTREVQTAVDGSFAHTFDVKWEDLCTHPRAVHIAFGDRTQEHELVVLAELLTPAPAPKPVQYSQTQWEDEQTYTGQGRQEVSAEVTIPISLSHSPVRVISDIDDTIKHSSILSGARSVFYNVFVRDLIEGLIPEMPEWYNEMWKRGVRFHYVSNGPFELLPVVTEFFEISNLPAGSIKLRSYAGRSLFGGFLSAPASRKRQGVLDVLESFPRSRFLLVGDSGEQDLELYAQLAAERPRQILAVFVRDVHQGGLVPVPEVKDPTGRLGGALPGVGPGGIGMGAPGQPYPQPMDQQQLQQQQQQVGPAGNRKRASDMVRRVSGHAVSAASNVRQRATSGQGDPLSISTSSLPRGATHQRSSSGASTDSASTPTSYAPYRSARSRAASGSSMTGAPIASSSSSSSGSIPAPAPALPDDYFTGRRSPAAATFGFTSSYTGSPLAEEPEHDASPAPLPAPQQRIVSEPERKRDELQARIYRARILMPDQIPVRVFRHPRECIEAREILDRLHIGTKRR